MGNFLKQIAVLLALTIPTITGLQLNLPATTHALSPPSCYADDSCSEKTECEFGNISRNWPKNTGYYRDCSDLPDNKPFQLQPLHVIFGVGLLVILLFLFRRVYNNREIRNKSPSKKKKLM